MNKHFVIAFVVIIIALVFGASNARATLIWNWEFEEQQLTPNPTDVVVLHAILFNDILSTENLVRNEMGTIEAALDFEDLGYYQFEWGSINGGPWDFGNQFRNLDLAPGDSYSFTFGHFTPQVEEVPIGLTFSGDAHFALDVFGDGNYINIPDNFNVTVANYPIDSDPPVPEPTSMILMGLGLIGIAFKRKTLS